MTLGNMGMASGSTPSGFRLAVEDMEVAIGERGDAEATRTRTAQVYLEVCNKPNGVSHRLQVLTWDKPHSKAGERKQK